MREFNVFSAFILYNICVAVRLGLYMVFFLGIIFFFSGEKFHLKACRLCCVVLMYVPNVNMYSYEATYQLFSILWFGLGRSFVSVCVYMLRAPSSTILK